MLLKKTVLPLLGRDAARRMRHGGSDPWVVAFVYTPDGKPEVVSAWYTEVLAYLDSHYRYMAHLTFWGSGKPRTAWLSSHFRVTAPARPFVSKTGGTNTPRRRHWTLTYPKDSKVTHTLRFRRIPRAWIAAYDKVFWEAERVVRDADNQTYAERFTAHLTNTRRIELSAESPINPTLMAILTGDAAFEKGR